MKWTPGSSSDNVEDRRGQSTGPGGGGFGRLGIGGVIVIGILSLVFKQNLFTLLDSGGGASTTSSGPVASSPAEDSLKDFITFVLNDAQHSWAQALPAQTRATYHDAHLVLFRDAVESACGQAASATGPFYCPGDEKVYIDLGFYQELKDRFGAPGDFAQAYVLAHELGHHVQNILGTSERVQRLEQQQPGSANAMSVRLELQADCYAGVWAHAARVEQRLEAGDIEEGLAAAASVGDDRIQRMSGRAVNPESWTHGSAAQRSLWFRRGFESGQIGDCDTFSGGR
jgi:predicted metalloprotease